MFFLLLNQPQLMECPKTSREAIALLPSQTETDRRQGVTVWISSTGAVPGGADINKGGKL